MARITVEDCLRNEPNRFALVKLASVRAKQLLTGSHPVTDTKGNRAIVSALREIASGKVHFNEAEPSTTAAPEPLESSSEKSVLLDGEVAPQLSLSSANG